MLTVLKIEAEEAMAFFEKNNIPHTPGQERFMGLSSEDGLFGVGSICLEGEKVYLDCVYAGGISELEHGLAKALLNMADLSGIKTVYGKNPELSGLYKKLRFKEENSEFTLSLEHYFTAEGHE